MRSASKPRSRKSSTSSAVEAAPRSTPSSSRTPAQSVHSIRWASSGARVAASAKVAPADGPLGACSSRSSPPSSRTTTSAATTTSTTTAPRRAASIHRLRVTCPPVQPLVPWWCESSHRARPRQRRTCAPPASSSSVPVDACCSCTGPSTTTGPSPRASSTAASTPPRRPCARWPRRPGCTCGCACRCSDQHYPVAAGHKTVHYWTGRAVGDDDVSGYRPNAEIDGVRWVDADEAADLLTYEHDRGDPRRGARASPRTRARRRAAPRPGPVAQRLAPRRRRAPAAAPRGAAGRAAGAPAGGVRRHAAGLARPARAACRPWSPTQRTTGWELETRRRLSEEGATPAGVRRVVDDVVERLDDGRGAVLCTHRPVLPEVFDALGLEDPGLEPGEMLVVHLRKGRVAGHRTSLSGAESRPRRTSSPSCCPGHRSLVAEWAVRVHPSFTVGRRIRPPGLSTVALSLPR